MPTESNLRYTVKVYSKSKSGVWDKVLNHWVLNATGISEEKAKQICARLNGF